MKKKVLQLVIFSIVACSPPVIAQSEAEAEGGDLSLHLAIASGGLVELTAGNLHAAIGIDVFGTQSTFIWHVGYNSVSPNQRISTTYWKVRGGVVAVDRGDSVGILTDTNTPRLGAVALGGYRFSFGNANQFFALIGIGAGFAQPVDDGTPFVVAVDFGLGVAF